jgi:NAD(P)-dependent dehydrogenase (short-subunit alcohol dehydrogenase family)
MRLNGKVAIVTGIGAGIGEATALRFAEEGARQILVDVDQANGFHTLERVRAAGGEAEFVAADVSDEAQCRAVSESAVKAFGGIDIVVNNAADFTQKNVEEATMADWDKVLGVNLIGPAMICKYAIPHMKKRGKGSIVNVASMSGIIAQHNFATYNSSKGGAITLGRCMALDLAPFNIRVNTVCPGCIDTSATRREAARFGLTFEEWSRNAAAKHMLNRIGTAMEVANAILFLASDEADFITAAELMVDGGYIHW